MLPVRSYAAVPHVPRLAGLWASIGGGENTGAVAPLVTEELRVAWPPRAYPTLQEAAAAPRRRRGKGLVLPRQRRQPVVAPGSAGMRSTPAYHALGESSSDDGASLVGQYECLELYMHFDGHHGSQLPQSPMPLDAYLTAALPQLAAMEPFQEVVGCPDSYGGKLWGGSLHILVWLCAPHVASRTADDIVAALSLFIAAAGSSCGAPVLLQEAGRALASKSVAKPRVVVEGACDQKPVTAVRDASHNPLSSDSPAPSKGAPPSESAMSPGVATPRRFHDSAALKTEMKTVLSGASGKYTFTGLATAVSTTLCIQPCHSSKAYVQAWEELFQDPEYNVKMKQKQLRSKRSGPDSGADVELPAGGKKARCGHDVPLQ